MPSAPSAPAAGLRRLRLLRAGLRPAWPPLPSAAPRRLFSRLGRPSADYAFGAFGACSRQGASPPRRLFSRLTPLAFGSHPLRWLRQLRSQSVGRLQIFEISFLESPPSAALGGVLNTAAFGRSPLCLRRLRRLQQAGGLRPPRRMFIRLTPVRPSASHPLRWLRQLRSLPSTTQKCATP